MGTISTLQAKISGLLKALGWWPVTAAIALVALGLRWYVVLVARPTCPVDAADSSGCFQINGDVLYQFTQGRLIGDGHFFKNGLEHLITGNLTESAGDPPLFSLLLGAWSALSLDTVTQQRVLAAVLGSGTVVLIALLARYLGGNFAGWVAGAVAAIHPLLWINDAMLMSESLYQLAVVAVIGVAYWYCQTPSLGRAAAVGAMIGVAALVRAEAAFLVVVMLAPLMLLSRQVPASQRLQSQSNVISLAIRPNLPTRPESPTRHRPLSNSESLPHPELPLRAESLSHPNLPTHHRISHRPQIRHLLVGAGMALLMVTPWLIYNNLRFEDPVTLTSASGSVLMAGSCDTAWSGPSMGYWANCFTELELWDDYEAAFPGITAESLTERTVYDESLVDSFNRHHALSYIGDNLGRYPLVMLARVGRVLEVYKVRDTLGWTWRIEGRWRTPSTVGLGLYYLLIVPAAIGAWRLRKVGLRLTPLLAWWPLVIVTAALTFGLTRYRVPVDIAMIVLASVGVTSNPHRELTTDLRT